MGGAGLGRVSALRAGEARSEGLCWPGIYNFGITWVLRSKGIWSSFDLAIAQISCSSFPLWIGSGESSGFFFFPCPILRKVQTHFHYTNQPNSNFLCPLALPVAFLPSRTHLHIFLPGVSSAFFLPPGYHFPTYSISKDV